MFKPSHYINRNHYQPTFRGIIAKARRTAGGRASGVPKVPRPADRCAAGGGSVACLETGDTILYEKRLVPGT